MQEPQFTVFFREYFLSEKINSSLKKLLTYSTNPATLSLGKPSSIYAKYTERNRLL